MRVVVEVTSGMQAGQKIWLQPGQTMKIGRTQSSDFVISGDERMSHEHFALDCSAEGCRLLDLNSANGTTLNGQRVAQATINDGDQIVAGDTRFTVLIEGALAAPAPGAGDGEQEVPPEVVKDQVLAFFRRLEQPLFAVLDAARDPLVLALLVQSELEYQSLYEGPKGETLAAVAPYLVHLPPDSPLLETLVQEGWGESWGVYLTCDTTFKEVRKHFRHFLLVKTDEGKKVYFRFYDPRVLRVFLPTCLPDEASQFFGPIELFFLEDETPTSMLRFAAEYKGAQEFVQLTTDQAAAGS